MPDIRLGLDAPHARGARWEMVSSKEILGTEFTTWQARSPYGVARIVSEAVTVEGARPGPVPTHGEVVIDRDILIGLVLEDRN